VESANSGVAHGSNPLIFKEAEPAWRTDPGPRGPHSTETLEEPKICHSIFGLSLQKKKHNFADNQPKKYASLFWADYFPY
jgi:hypothetical protein